MNRRPLAAIALVTLFMFLVLVMILTFNVSSTPDFLLPIVRYHFELMIVIALGGMLVGAGTYYLMSEQVARKEVVGRKNTQSLLKFLSEDERKVVKKLMEGNGKGMQYELTRIEGISRLKAHRIVQKLQHQEIIQVEKVGKVNSITLAPEIKEALTE